MKYCSKATTVFSLSIALGGVLYAISNPTLAEPVEGNFGSSKLELTCLKPSVMLLPRTYDHIEHFCVSKENFPNKGETASKRSQLSCQIVPSLIPASPQSLTGREFTGIKPELKCQSKPIAAIPPDADMYVQLSCQAMPGSKPTSSQTSQLLCTSNYLFSN